MVHILGGRNFSNPEYGLYLRFTPVLPAVHSAGTLGYACRRFIRDQTVEPATEYSLLCSCCLISLMI